MSATEKAAYDREYRKQNSAHRNASRKAWRARNTERDSAYSRAWQYQKKYGITVEKYEEMLQDQGGVCAICKKPPGKQRLDVDHDHNTGAVRGLLHNTCNRALGLLKDSSSITENATAYLKKFGK